MAFGENVKMVSQAAMRRGVILDAEAARLLGERGIDTGIRRFGKRITTDGEYFDGEEEYVYGAYKAHVMELDERAEVDSSIAYTEDGQERKAPGAFFYENGEGHRFWVFAFDAYFNNEGMYRSYSRARQLVKAVGRLTGRALPACSLGNPDLYLLCKRDERELAVGLWNICPDDIYEPMVELEHACRGIRFLNCTGRMEGNRVYLSQMPPSPSPDSWRRPEIGDSIPAVSGHEAVWLWISTEGHGFYTYCRRTLNISSRCWWRAPSWRR